MANRMTFGSAAWIAAEKENVQALLHQEREEVVFPAQHEMEWLNEHMTEIFNSNCVDVANVFKTPGKLRGKTPRTVRKRQIETRVPLSDVFSSKQPRPQSPVKAAKTATFEVAQDLESQQPVKSHTDSGYHGSSQVEEGSRQPTPEIPARSPLRMVLSPCVETQDSREGIRTTEGSFHSAKEDQTLKVAPIQVEHQELQASKDSEAKKEEDNIQDVDHPHFDDIGSPSDESTPDRPIVRKKSSMTFASLPARQPLKTSMGARVSRTSHAADKRDSRTQKAVFTSENDDDDNIDVQISDDDSNVKILGHDESELDWCAAKEHSKASTQRLHQRIQALGTVPLSQPSKSVSSAAATVPTTATAHQQEDDQWKHADDEDDWIEPLSDSCRKDTVMDEVEDEPDIRAPELIAHEERMRELSPSPARPGFGHTKSASTATLASPMKTAMAPPPSPAKSISVSNPTVAVSTPQGSPNRFMDGVSASRSKIQSIMKTAKGLFTSSASVSAAAKLETVTPKIEKDSSGSYPMLDKPLPESPAKEGRRTRSSTEREKKQVRNYDAVQRMEDQLERARENERQKASQQKATSPTKEDASKTSRPVRPGRDVPKTRPQPVSIRIGTVLQRMPVSIACSNQEVLPAEPKRPGLTQKASTTSLQSSGSVMTLKTSVNSQTSKPKALLAAEKKREQDEKEAQRKLEQKKEVERKRAAQQEEARRREQEHRAELERKERDRIVQERVKRQAQQQAIERKRQEVTRRAEQQRAEREVSRPPSRLGQQMSRPLINNHALPTNSAKPAKRPIEDDAARLQAPKFGAASQQADSKRRRTEDEMEPPVRPTMSGAPIRQSQLGKKPSIFNHSSYQQAPINHFPQPPGRGPPQMAQYATSKIPFAEPGTTIPAKTPVSAYQHRTVQVVKSSPHYQNGESIHLPEIPTDSEDEDSDDESNAFPIPDWATPGHLTEQLIRQEGIDGDAVFGPIAPLKMEEIFAKGNKDRLKRLRDRTSSANWAMSGDGLTLEEVRHDREQRERMRIEGGWRYGT